MDVCQVCDDLVSTPESAVPPESPARGREGFPEATGGSGGAVHSCSGGPQPAPPRVRGREEGRGPRSFQRAAGGEVALRSAGGVSRICCRSPGYFWLARVDGGGGRRQGAASPSSPPLSVAGGRSDLATPLGAGPQRSRRAAPSWLFSRWGERNPAGDARTAGGGGGMPERRAQSGECGGNPKVGQGSAESPQPRRSLRS